VVREGELGAHWLLADGLSKTVKLVHWSKWKEVLGDLHGVSSGGHECQQNACHNNSEIILVRCEMRRLELLPTIGHLGSKLRHINTEPGPDALMYHQETIQEHRHRGSFSYSKRGNRYPLIAVDYIKWPEVYVVGNQETLTKTDVIVTNFCRLASPEGIAHRRGYELLANGVTRPENPQDAHHPSAFTIGRHGGSKCEGSE
jgi:hypothetical protein